MTDSRRYLSSMPRLLPRSISLALLCALAVLAPAASALADPAFYDGSSTDGKVAVFSSKEQMVPGDTDGELDVFVRSFDGVAGEYVTREVSLGPKGGNDTLPALYNGMSADGTKVFFSTAEPLVPGDTDPSRDVYLRDLVQNRTVLVSQGDDSCAGQSCGNGETNSDFAPEGVAADGDTVFFTTTESLDGSDDDASLDIYARRIAAEETVLVSAGDSSCTAGPCGSGSEGASFRGIDQAGDKAVFRTAEILSSQDADSEADIYVRDLSTGSTKLVSLAGPCPIAPCTPSYGGISPNGLHVFFETSEQLSVGKDTDSVQDVYDWSGGAATLASIGTSGGNGTGVARYAETSADGKAVYFLSEESLEAADTDKEQDVYRNLEGTTTLISAGEEGKGNGAFLASLDFVSQQGSPERAVFSTSESLVAEDADSNQDVYERSAGKTTLISTGPEASGPSFNASFAGASADGSKVFFVTTEHLVPQDTDNSADIYRRSEAGTVLVSVGQINGNKELSASPQGVSSDGTRAFFVTQERLTEGDNDAEQDVYGWSEGTTLLVSAKNGVTLGPPPPTLEKTVPASPNPSTLPTIVGQADPGSAIKIYKTANCSGQVVAQGNAEELASPGLTVTVEVALGSTTNYSATAEAEGIVSTCSSSISYKQEDPPPPPPPVEEGGGSGGGSTGGTGSTGGKTGSGGSGGSVKGGVVYVTPLPRITFGPAWKTRLRRPVFRFVDSTEQPGTQFFCRVDKRRWSGCSSPIKVKKLKLGRHVFSLKAVNAVGTASPAPVKRAFKVVGR